MLCPVLAAFSTFSNITSQLIFISGTMDFSLCALNDGDSIVRMRCHVSSTEISSEVFNGGGIATI